MMFGTREPFVYDGCSACGTLFLRDIPNDMSRFYPDEYYSFGRVRVRQWKHRLNRLILPLYLQSSTFAKWMGRVRGFPESVQVLSRLRITADARILDVGSGGGRYIARLYGLGFSHLLGVDKYIEDDIALAPGVRICRAEGKEIGDTFDVVTSHHSFEHLPDPHESFEHLARLVSSSGALVIRTPNAASWTAREYGAHWFALDPPRHLVVYTPESMRILADEHGFRVEEVTFDSQPEEIIFSEQYRRDIPYNAPNSYANTGENGPFAVEELREFNRKTRELNAAGNAGNMCLVLRRGHGD